MLSWVALASTFEVIALNNIALLADKLVIDALVAVIIFTDKLFMDTLLAVILSIDALIIDTSDMETLLAVILFVDMLSADKLFADTLNMDALFTDKLNIDALIIETFCADKFVKVFVTALKLILLPEKLVVVFRPPKLNVFEVEPVSIFVVAVLEPDKIVTIPLILLFKISIDPPVKLFHKLQVAVFPLEDN